jgi:hypothetical protein
MKTGKLRCVVEGCGGKVQMAPGRTFQCVRCGAGRDLTPGDGGPQFADPVRNAETKEETALRERRVRRMR